jgi:hypothetical protein
VLDPVQEEREIRTIWRDIGPAHGEKAELHAGIHVWEELLSVFEIIQAHECPVLREVGEELFVAVVGSDAAWDDYSRTAIAGYQLTGEPREDLICVDVPYSTQGIPLRSPDEMALAFGVSLCPQELGPQLGIGFTEFRYEALPCCGVWGVGYVGGFLGEELFLLEFDAFPRGVAEDAVETTGER